MSASDIPILLEDCLRAGDARPCGKLMDAMRRHIAMSVVVACRPFGDAGRQAAEDLVQETYVRLCRDGYRVLRSIEGSDSRVILTFVRAVAASATLDYFRSATAAKRSGGFRPAPLDDAILEDDAREPAERALQRRVLLDQIDKKMLELLSPSGTAARDRRIFWLHYRHGLTAKDIAGLAPFGLSTKGVESLLHRLVRALRESILDEPKGFSPEPLLEEGDR